MGYDKLMNSLLKIFFSFEFLFYLLALGIVSCSHRSPSVPPPQVFGDDQPSSNASVQGPANGSTSLSLVLGLARSQSALAQRVDDLGNPSSDHYQAFTSINAVANEFGANGKTQKTVLEYMAAQGVDLTMDVTGSFAYGYASINQLDKIFSTQLMDYQISGVGNFIAPSLSNSPTLPRPLQGYVTEVLGLNTEPSTWRNLPPNPNPPTPRPSNEVVTPGSPTISGTPEGCSEALAKNGFTPNQLLTAYGVEPLHQAGFQGQGITMAVMELNAFDQTSIHTFTSCYGIQPSFTPQVVQVGSSVPTEASGEPFLDIEVLSMVAPQLSNLYVFQTAPQSFADWVILYAAPLNSQNTEGNPVNVISSSLGNCELKWTSTYVQLMEQVFMSANLSGVHVFNSAGDSGSSDCYHYDGVITAQSAGYPGSSKYVTSVGGTDLLLNSNNSISGEGVWNDLDFPVPYNTGTGAGGGGPSIYNSAPSWQYGTQQGTAMRTTPDVAFFAAPRPGYTIYSSLNGWYNDGGTSAATPFLAASTALLLQMGNSLGQNIPLSPLWIYNLAYDASTYNAAFSDIVVGNNDLFGVGCCNSAVGYDQASGWGSMNISEIAELLFAF